MPRKPNIERLRTHLIQVREFIEPYANKPGVREQLVVLDRVIGPYIERASAGEFELEFTGDSPRKEIPGRPGRRYRNRTRTPSWQRSACADRNAGMGATHRLCGLPRTKRVKSWRSGSPALPTWKRDCSSPVPPRANPARVRAMDAGIPG